MSAKTLFFSVGEPSGDQHVGKLVESLKDASGGFHFRGFGGQEMRQAGCRLDFELTQLAVMGIVEVLPKLRQFFSVADIASRAFAENRPDAVVLADFPGFNWHIAKRAKRFGIPVFYYLPPQLWAWGSWRIRKVRRWVDHVLSVLPFEHEWYSERGIKSTYVGHPFFDAVSEKVLDPKVMAQFQTVRDQGRRLVAVLPGSRSHEVHRNWPVMLAAIKELSARFPDVRFQVAAFRDSHCLWCRQQAASAGDLPIDYFVGKTSEVIQAAETAMMVSGSVSLELLARDTPATVIYRMGRTMHWTGKTLVRVNSMTLPNLMAQKTVFPELASSGAPDDAISFMIAQTSRFLADADYWNEVRSEMSSLRSQFAQPGATRRAAATICAEMGIKPGTHILRPNPIAKKIAA